MRLSLFATAALLAFLVSAPSVEARPYHGYKSHRIEHTHANWTGRRHYSSRQYSQRRYTGRHNNRYAYRHHSYRKYAYRQQRVHQRYAQHRSYGHRRYASASVGGRPRAWCGWWMRTQRGGGPEYNLAANWRHYGRASGPQVGAVVVWPHHVGMITGRSSNGRWIVKSGNDGNAVRERPMSVAGAVFRMG
jgi:hypothetical protein